MPIRPPSRTCNACLKPSPSLPMRFPPGTRTESNESDAVSLARIPNLFSFLPTENPGIPFSRMNAETPWCLDLSVTASTTKVAPTEPCVIKVLHPFNTQSFPSFTAVVFIPPASLPEDDSVKPQPPSFFPEHKSGRYFFFCSSLPKLKMCDVHNPLCAQTLRPMDGSTLEISSTRIVKSRTESPAPLYSSGNVAPRKPSAASFAAISKGNSCDSSYFIIRGRSS